MLSYWIWLSIYVFLPMLVMVAWKHELLSKYRKTILLCGFGSLLVASVWDHYAIEAGLRSLPQQEILGIGFAGLPLEEWIFISFIGMELCMAALIFGGAGDE